MAKKNYMTRQQFYQLVANEAGYKYDEVRYVLDLAFTILGRLLAKGKSVRISSFGLFEAFKTAKRIVYNFSNEPVEIAPRLTPKFRPSESLKQAVNGGDNDYIIYGDEEG